MAGPVLAQEWSEFSSADGRFSIVMPGKATEGSFDSQNGDIKITAHTFTAVSQSIDLMCGYYDFPSVPKDVEKLFDGTRDGSLRNIRGTLLSEQKVNLEGYLGRRFRSSAGKVFVDEEMYLVASVST